MSGGHKGVDSPQVKRRLVRRREAGSHLTKTPRSDNWKECASWTSRTRRGCSAARVLGDFGADVIKIERPAAASPARTIGPVLQATSPTRKKSLFWFATSTSKGGITLNIELPDGQELFTKLVKKADIVVESFSPGYMDCIGLGYADLKVIKPDIIFTSITPFGQTGPDAHYQATDLVGAAMGGMARILGDLGRPPVRMGADPQSYFHAGLQGALGSTTALLPPRDDRGGSTRGRSSRCRMR